MLHSARRARTDLETLCRHYSGKGTPSCLPEESRLEKPIDHLAWRDRCESKASTFHRETNPPAISCLAPGVVSLPGPLLRTERAESPSNCHYHRQFDSHQVTTLESRHPAHRR